MIQLTLEVGWPRKPQKHQTHSSYLRLIAEKSTIENVGELFANKREPYRFYPANERLWASGYRSEVETRSQLMCDIKQLHMRVKWNTCYAHATLALCFSSRQQPHLTQ